MIADLSPRASLLMYQFMLTRDAYGTTTESELGFASVKIIWREAGTTDLSLFIAVMGGL